jgi:aspartyl/glutamyl-tRNA(Asn/Gln) amidotransferase C subunit
VTNYQERLGRVLDYVNELNKIQFEKLEFVQHAPSDAVSFRNDEPRLSGIQEAIMKNAPQIVENSFMLPPIMDHE